MAERELIYRIKVVADTGNQSVLRAFVEQRAAAERQITANLQREIARRTALRRQEVTDAQSVADREFQSRVRLLDRLEREDRRRREFTAREGALAATRAESLARSTSRLGGAVAEGAAAGAGGLAAGRTGRAASAASDGLDDLRRSFKAAQTSIDELAASTAAAAAVRSGAGAAAGGAAGAAAAGEGGLLAFLTSGPALAAMAAIAASIGAGIVIRDVATGAASRGEGLGGMIASTEASWATSAIRWSGFRGMATQPGLPQLLQPFAEAGQTEAMGERLSARRSSESEFRARRAAQSEGVAALQEAEFGVGLDRRLRAGRFGSFGRYGAALSLTDQRSQAESEQGLLKGMRDRPGVNAERLYNAELETAERRLTIEHKIIEEKRRGVREGIEGAERELELTQKRLEQDRRRLTEAAEGFGQMHPFEQMRAISAKTKADQFGAGSLSMEERRSLRAVGTDDAVGIARRGDIAAAERAGFSRFFGGSQRQQLGEDTDRVRKLEVEVKGKRELLLKLDADEQRVVANIGRELQTILDDRDRAILNLVREQIRRSQAEVNAQSREQLLHRANLAGR